MKGIQTGIEELEFSLFTDDMVLSIGASEDSINTLLEILRVWQVVGYKINENMIQRNNPQVQHYLKAR